MDNNVQNHNVNMIMGTKNSLSFILGLIGIILGVLTLMMSWIPFFGLITLPISGVGGLCSLVGLVVSLLKHKQKIGYPICGLIFCVLSIGMVIFSTGGAAVTAGAIAEEIDKEFEIQKQKKLQKKREKILKLQSIKHKNENFIKEMKSSLKVSVNDINYTKQNYRRNNYSSSLKVDLIFTNKITKPIRGTKGRMFIYNLFDERLLEFDVIMDKTVLPGQPIVKSFKFEKYSSSVISWNKLISSEYGKLKYCWEPYNMVMDDKVLKVKQIHEDEKELL